MSIKGTALVLGATGGLGGELARQLAAAAWRVRALHRDPARAAGAGNFEWVRGDAMRHDDVRRAAEGADVIVHAVNPPGYRRWQELVMPMLESTISAAGSSRACVVLPGNVYNFGPDAFPVLTEDSPQHPKTRKGAVRVQMERRLRDSGCRTLVVRAGDFIGASPSSWFGQMVRSGRPVARVLNPAFEGVGHQWAYLPDVAATMRQLLERRAELQDFSVFHMRGYWDEDGRGMVQAVVRAVMAAGQPAPRVTRFPWWLVRMGAPVVPLFRELQEMRYLWEVPVRMDNERLRSFLGREPATPLDDAVRTTLRALGCLG